MTSSVASVADFRVPDTVIHQVFTPAPCWDSRMVWKLIMQSPCAHSILAFKRPEAHQCISTRNYSGPTGVCISLHAPRLRTRTPSPAAHRARPYVNTICSLSLPTSHASNATPQTGTLLASASRTLRPIVLSFLPAPRAIGPRFELPFMLPAAPNSRPYQ